MKPIGMNATPDGIKSQGGFIPYMERAASYGVSVVRIHIPGSVSQVCDPDLLTLTDECKQWISGISTTAKEYGIELMPLPYFLHPTIWKTNPFGEKYQGPFAFLRDGLGDAKELLSRLVEAFGDSAFAWELINEMSMRLPIEQSFATELIMHCQSLTDAPATVSFAYPETVQSTAAIPVIQASDVVIFHTYNSTNPENGMLWYRSTQKDPWDRMMERRRNVATISEMVTPHVQGKPWFVSEDPIIPVQGAFGDFFARLFGNPTSENYRAHFRSVLREWVRNGAMMHGMMWSCCRGDLPVEYLEELKSFSEEE
jgi:hypothetical protein